MASVEGQRPKDILPILQALVREVTNGEFEYRDGRIQWSVDFEINFAHDTAVFQRAKIFFEAHLTDNEVRSAISLLRQELQHSLLFARLPQSVLERTLRALSALQTEQRMADESVSPQHVLALRVLTIFQDISESIAQHFQRPYDIPKYHSMLSVLIAESYLRAVFLEDIGEEVMQKMLNVMRTHHSVQGYVFNQTIDREEMKRRVSDDLTRWLMLALTEANIIAEGQSSVVRLEDVELVRREFSSRHII